MGFIDRRRYRRAYEGIVNNGGTVLVLVAPDVDALAACRILARLLVHDHVAHNIVPVSGWAELARINREMVEGNDALRSIILLNLGSLVDLADFFNLPQNGQHGCTLHVIDSHRPCNLDNLFSNQPEAQSIVVWDDGDVEEDMQEERTAYEALEYEPDSDSEEDEDIDSEEEDARWRERQRQMLQDSDSEHSDNDSDGSSSSSRGKRRRINNNGEDTIMQPKRLSKAKKALYQNRIQKYYNAGTWYGQSVAGQIYILANEINREDNDTLWLAILGLTYQFTSNLIDRERYETYSSIFTNEVLRLNIDPPPSHTHTTLSSISSNNPDDKSIRTSDEFRFMLFRHWNLYDSMYHSGYVAGKMKLYRERGRKNLQGLLAKMGFSLEQCRQTYAHMDMDLKRSLPSKMQDIAPEYGLFDLIYPSFCRVYGFQSVLSCGDVVECVSALLEVANGVRLDFGGDHFSGPNSAASSSTLWNASHWNSSLGKGEAGDADDDDGYGTGGASSDRENTTNNNGADSVQTALARSQEAAAIAAAKAKKREEVWWVRNFWMAYDSLGNDTALLRSSLPLSMALHRSIIRQGISILDKQSIKTLREFRFCVLKEGPDLPVFCHPSTISRLATWLVDGIRDILDGSNALHGSEETGKKNRKPRKALPFILAVLDEKRDVFLVVGLTGSLEFGDVSKNKFGLAFQNAARSSKTRTRHDKFDASIVEVRKDDLVSFLQRVNIKL